MSIRNLNRLHRRSVPLLMLVLLTGGIPRQAQSAAKLKAQVKNGFDLQGSLVPAKEIRQAYRRYDESSSVIFPVSHRDRRYHPKEQVIGIELDGEFKAYPFVELARTSGVIHDAVNGRTIKVVFDAENASAVAFDDAGKELPSVTGFWFAWVAFHPDTEVFQAG